MHEILYYFYLQIKKQVTKIIRVVRVNIMSAKQSVNYLSLYSLQFIIMV